jgi:hypothetical protein
MTDNDQPTVSRFYCCPACDFERRTMPERAVYHAAEAQRYAERAQQHVRTATLWLRVAFVGIIGQIVALTGSVLGWW